VAIRPQCLYFFSRHSNCVPSPHPSRCDLFSGSANTNYTQTPLIYAAEHSCQKRLKTPRSQPKPPEIRETKPHMYPTYFSSLRTHHLDS